MSRPSCRSTNVFRAQRVHVATINGVAVKFVIDIPFALRVKHGKTLRERVAQWNIDRPLYLPVVVVPRLNINKAAKLVFGLFSDEVNDPRCGIAAIQRVPCGPRSTSIRSAS